MQENTQHQESISELEHQIGYYYGKYSTKVQTGKTIKDMLDDVISENQSLKQQLAQLQSNITTYTNQSHEYKAQITHLQTKITKKSLSKKNHQH